MTIISATINAGQTTTYLWILYGKKFCFTRRLPRQMVLESVNLGKRKGVSNYSHEPLDTL